MRDRRDQAERTQKTIDDARADAARHADDPAKMYSVDPLPVRVSAVCAREWDSFAKPRNALPIKQSLAKSFNDTAGMCRLAPDSRANAAHIQAIAGKCLRGTSAFQTYYDKAVATQREMDAILAAPACASGSATPTAAPEAARCS